MSGVEIRQEATSEGQRGGGRWQEGWPAPLCRASWSTAGRNGYMYVQCSMGNNSKSRQTRVTVHVFCKSSHRALHLCEFL